MKRFHAAAGVLAMTVLIASPALGAGAAPKLPMPPEGFQGQWFTTPNGCSYSRAKAPGYPTSWHLILNPHHIGQPPAKRSCPAVLGQ